MHKLIPMVLFFVVFAGAIHAEQKGLSDIYDALRLTLPLGLRQTLIDSKVSTNIAIAEAPYQVRFLAESQGDVDSQSVSAMETSLYAKLSILTADKILPLTDAAEAHATIQRLAEMEAQLDRYKTATTLYFRALTAQEAAKHTARIVTIVTKQQAWLKNQIAIGRNKPSSLSSNQLTLSRLQLQQAQYQRQKREAMFQLSSLTGIDPQVSLQIPTTDLPAEPSSSLLYQRPDIRKQQWRIREVAAERSALSWTPWPQLDVFGRVTPQDKEAQIGFAASWPLFDTRERVLAESLLTSQYTLENLTLQENFRAAVGELWAQYDTLRSLETEYQLAKKTVTAAEAQYKQYQAELAQNLVTLLDVLQTVNGLHETQLDLSRRQIAVQEAIALFPITTLGQLPNE